MIAIEEIDPKRFVLDRPPLCADEAISTIQRILDGLRPGLRVDGDNYDDDPPMRTCCYTVFGLYTALTGRLIDEIAFTLMARYSNVVSTQRKIHERKTYLRIVLTDPMYRRGHYALDEKGDEIDLDEFSAEPVDAPPQPCVSIRGAH